MDERESSRAFADQPIVLLRAFERGIGQLAGEAAFEGAQKYKWLVRKGKG